MTTGRPAASAGLTGGGVRRQVPGSWDGRRAQALAEVCAEYARCTTDGGAAFDAPVGLSDLSPIDCWHPSITGQAAIAQVVWESLGY